MSIAARLLLFAVRFYVLVRVRVRVLCTRGDSAHLGERATLKLMCTFSDGKHNTATITGNNTTVIITGYLCYFVAVVCFFGEGC